MKQLVPPSILLLFCLLVAPAVRSEEFHQFQTVTVDFEIEPTKETAPDNPFLDFRLNVTFSHADKHYRVPGFYAADGNAAQTGASSGWIPGTQVPG